MSQTVVMVHTIPGLVPAFTIWASESLPDCQVLHLLDEPLLARVKRRGNVAPEDDDRLFEHIRLAESIEAAAVLVTCSSVSDSVARVQRRAAIPVVAADDAMAAEAVQRGHRIALVATAATTLDPSERRLRVIAERDGQDIEVTTRFVDNALAALLAGDPETHDRLVTAAVNAVADDAEVIVLAQATMARVLPALAEAPPRVPVLASPQLALAEVRRLILLDAVDAASGQHEV